MEPDDIRQLVRQSLEEYLGNSVTETLAEEKRRRESLEKRLNELATESDRHREMAEQMDRNATIKSELHRLGVRRPDLAIRLLKDEVFRGDDGELYARGEKGPLSLGEFLTKFVGENPEFLPARIAGGSGASGTNRREPEGSFDLNRIRPGMSAEEMQRAKREIARLAGKEAAW